MAEDMRLYTDSVRQVASNIDRKNKELTRKFSDVEKAMNALDSAWDGSASFVALGTFKAIKNAYVENREKIIDNHVVLLRDVVATGGEYVEEFNTSLADTFI